MTELDKLSPNFTLEEFIHSDTAMRLSIDQTPSPLVLQALTATAKQLEGVRDLLGNAPIYISSGYRSYALNKAIGGSPNSDHLDGWAVDFTAPRYGNPQQICKAIANAYSLSFSQCIYEGRWVHISFRPTGKRQVLTAHFAPGKTTYSEGIA